MSFSWSQISQMLDVSRMTIYRRRVEYDLLVDPSASISDVDLKEKVLMLRSQHPDIGETMVWGQLRSMGIQVTCERVRFALRQSDPLNSGEELLQGEDLTLYRSKFSLAHRYSYNI